MYHLHHRILAALCLIFAAAFAGAQSWDAAYDFPTGPDWSYGWRMPGAEQDFTPMQKRSPGTCGVDGLECFSKWGQAIWPLPQIGINATGKTIDYKTGAFSHMVIPVQTLNMRPDVDGGMPVLRWTAPTDGEYIILGSAQVIDYATQGAVVHITGLQDKALSAVFGDAKSFTAKRKLKAGDSIDFAVEAVGDYFYASTELRVSVLRK